MTAARSTSRLFGRVAQNWMQAIWLFFEQIKKENMIME